MKQISLRAAMLWAMGTAAAFHAAYSVPACGLFIFAYLFCLLQLARTSTARQAFYSGLATGLLCAAPQLTCFWVIFGRTAIVLWVILAFWIGLFVAMARLCLVRFGTSGAAIFIPFVWTGLEYFRGELYYLRFSWLNVGYALAETPLRPVLRWIGMYGVGFVGMVAAVALSMIIMRGGGLMRPRKEKQGETSITETVETVSDSAGSHSTQLKLGVNERGRGAVGGAVCGLAVIVLLVVLLIGCHTGEGSGASSQKLVRIAGVQLEFPIPTDVISALDKLLATDSSNELFVLSEYTFDGAVPDKLKAWCREHQRYLVVGGKEDGPNRSFYNTAFVIGPTGEIVFQQGKSVPIQFFKDGLPAREQKLWDSPWGKIGICICYDLSYTRVTDELVRLGAQALIVPTMDVADWGRRQHELHARVAPVRAAEYGVPIFRLASSGISQGVNRFGKVTASAPFPGPGATLRGTLVLDRAGTLPADRWIAPVATGVTGLLILWFILRRLIRPRVL